MQIKPIDTRVGVTGQLQIGDVERAVAQGYRAIICNRPDGEEAGQPTAAQIGLAARAAGIECLAIPLAHDDDPAAAAIAMARALATLPQPILAFCRSGARSEKLIALAAREQDAGARVWDIVIVGGGAAGIGTAASIRRRNRDATIAIVEPSESHYYQPGWTMVGGGVFSREFTHRAQHQLIPRGVEWIKQSVAGFLPDTNRVTLGDGSSLGYRVLIVCPGIALDWGAIEGLPETLGQNGVTSNYGYDLAPYTNRLVKDWRGGRAIFTQPPMPIKCAGAPQKAMYLSCHRWEKAGMLGRSHVQFHTAAPVLFGVPAYVPALMDYVARYGVDLRFGSRLVAIDGAARLALFEQQHGEDTVRTEQPFDMIHVVPPQRAPDFVATSPLAAPSGFVAVDETTLRHPVYANVFALGDACAASNAKTVAAARKQAPVVAVNALAVLAGAEPTMGYDGYGSCPLTVERGKIVLAEFGYGGKLLPSFPNWLIDGTRPSRLSWLLKDTILPPVYWHGMLKGREWLASPRPIAVTPSVPGA